MTTPVFSIDVPKINQSIKSGGVAINNNFRSLNSSYSKDHVALDDPNGDTRGIHTKITLAAPLDVDPKPEGNETVFYSKMTEGSVPLPTFIASDGIPRTMWALSQTAGDYSLTPQGYLYFPNGLIMMWGSGSVNPTSGSSFFSVPFPKSFKTVFSVNVTFIKAVTATEGITDVWVATTSTSNFTIRNTDSSTYRFNYFAVGM